MSRLITTGNLAFFEYPKPHHAIPKFTMEENGILWIEGYNIPLFPGSKPIRAMKRFDTGLKNYMVIGRYSYAKDRIQGDFDHVISDQNIDIDNCVVLIKKDNTNF